MHPIVYRHFETLIRECFHGESILEVGALPGETSLLNLDCFQGRRKVGINLLEAGVFSDFEIIRCDANDMGIFEEESFDLVLCNATLEHDRFFWKSVGEMKRVCRKGGWIIIGVPGFARRESFLSKFGFLPDSFRLSTPTFCLHHAPGCGDYYRFSEECMKEIMLQGLVECRTTSIMKPPRIIGIGRK